MGQVADMDRDDLILRTIRHAVLAEANDIAARCNPDAYAGLKRKAAQHRRAATLLLTHISVARWAPPE